MIKIESEELAKMVKEEIKSFVKEQDLGPLLIDMKELCRLLSLSRPTVDMVFMSDPNFPRIRVGKKLLFNRKAIEKYIDEWTIKNHGKVVGKEEE